MKINQKSNILFTLLTILVNININWCQTTKNEKETYVWFDIVTGEKNLEIYNGPISTNPYRTFKDNSIYLFNDQFENGVLIYDHLPYYNVGLKYDIFRDILVVKSFDKSENIGICVNESKVKAFIIKDKNFIKIDADVSKSSLVQTGYYEEFYINSTTILYIKHHKSSQKYISDEQIVYNFKRDNSYFIKINDNFSQFKSKSDLIKIFSSHKQLIKNFYLKNKEIQKNDDDIFFKTLLKAISNNVIK